MFPCTEKLTPEMVAVIVNEPEAPAAFSLPSGETDTLLPATFQVIFEGSTIIGWPVGSKAWIESWVLPPAGRLILRGVM